MDFEDWLLMGIDAGWISVVACATHNGVPLAPGKDAAWEAGWDPCQPVVRVWGPDGIEGQPDYSEIP
jgi:hypothetical protein